MTKETHITPEFWAFAVLQKCRHRPLIDMIMEETHKIKTRVSSDEWSPLKAQRKHVRWVTELVRASGCEIVFNKRKIQKGRNYFARSTEDYPLALDFQIRCDTTESHEGYHAFLHEVAHYLLHTDYDKHVESYADYRRERFLMEGQADSLAEIMMVTSDDYGSKYMPSMAHCMRLVTKANATNGWKLDWFDTYDKYWITVRHRLKGILQNP